MKKNLFLNTLRENINKKYMLGYLHCALTPLLNLHLPRPTVFLNLMKGLV